MAVPIGGSLDWASLPSSVQVIKGWIMQSESGMSARLGDLDEQLVTARCNVLLSDPPSHPIDALLWAAERVQLGDPAGDMVDSVVEWVDEVGKQHRRDSHHANALVAAALVLAAAGEPRASCDAVTVVQRGSNLQTELGSLGAARWLGSLRAGLIDDRNGLMLFGSAPSAWVGRNVEVRDLVTLHGTVSYALRWHGDRPALLWEQSGQSPLRCGLDPTFVSRAVRGEELLAAPTCT